MKNKKKIFVIIILILLGLAAVLLTKTDREKNEETALPENEVVVDNADHLEETVEETIENSEEQQEILTEEKTDAQENASVEKEDASVQEDASVKKEDTLGQKQDASILPGGIQICEIGSYIGSYVEDGSDEFVNNIMMVVLENKGNEYIQLANIKINDQYLFGVTTLFPGEKVMVLEKNRAEYVENMKITSAEIFDVAVFHEIPTMCEEILKIETKDGMINIENISGKDFPGGKVFFKNVVDDKYLGGITYFSSIPKMKKGEAVKVSTGHFEEGRSKMLFVTHAE